MKILAVGDVVGHIGLAHLSRNLRPFIERNSIDMTIVNGENAAEIHGTSPRDAEAIFDAGADVITGGNHTFNRRDFYETLASSDRVLRPHNYPPGAPGSGYTTLRICGYNVLCMNLQGNVAMNETLPSPFLTANSILQREQGKFDIAILDFHAEATSEKIAMGLFLDGRVSAVFGTHTHVATADARVLPEGTGYITDIGMTGPTNSVLGVMPELIIGRFLTAMPSRHVVAEGPCRAHGAIFEIDPETGKCLSVKRAEF